MKSRDRKEKTACLRRTRLTCRALRRLLALSELVEYRPAPEEWHELLSKRTN